MKVSHLFFLIIILIFSSCKNEEKKSNENQKVESEQEIAQQLEVESHNFDSFEKFLKKDNGKIQVINFWATWCAPCVEELPYFIQLDQHEDVEVLLVSLDMPNEKESRLKPFLQRKEISIKTVLLDDPDSNRWIPKVDEDWDGAIPATLIYHKKKRKFYAKKFKSYNELLQKVKDIKNNRS